MLSSSSSPCATLPSPHAAQMMLFASSSSSSQSPSTFLPSPTFVHWPICPQIGQQQSSPTWPPAFFGPPPQMALPSRRVIPTKGGGNGQEEWASQKIEHAVPPPPMAISPPPSSGDESADGKSAKNGTGGCTRRYKTPSPQLLRLRREAANARERRRMNGLNKAFDQLRKVLPTLGDGRRLSKFETLLMAQQYIDSLGELLVDGKMAAQKGAKCAHRH